MTTTLFLGRSSKTSHFFFANGDSQNILLETITIHAGKCNSRGKEHLEAVEWFAAHVRHLDCSFVELAELASTDKTCVVVILSLDKAQRQRNSVVPKHPGQSVDKSLPWNLWPMGCFSDAKVTQHSHIPPKVTSKQSLLWILFQLWLYILESVIVFILVVGKDVCCGGI